MIPDPSVRGRVLIADDEPITAHLSARTLSDAGYDVTIATDGAEALERMAHEAFDLVITDALMPQMDGFELVRTMRSSERLSRVPVLFVTGCGEEQAMSRGYRWGCDSFLVKPVRPGELIEEVDALMLKATGTSAKLNHAALSGRLDAMPIVAVLAFLHTQEQTGILKLSRFGSSGEIVLERGQLIDARVGHALWHEPALAALLGWNAGAFRFDVSDVSHVPPVLVGSFADVIERAELLRREP